MSRASTLLLIGVLTLLVPFSGLPASIRALLTVLLGAAVLGVGLSLRVRDVRRAQGDTPPRDAAPTPEMLAAPLSEMPPRDVSSV